MAITGGTRLAAVIGQPVRHSLSPGLFNAAFVEAGLDWVFLAFDIAPADLPGFTAAARTLEIEGFSVTMPHKEAILSLVDDVSPSAAALSAANCICNDAGVLRAFNTDGDGFVDGVAHDLNFDMRDGRIAILGAGGAARSVVEASARRGAAEIVVVNRSPEAAERAVALGGEVARVGGLSDIAKADLVVNATPLGMVGELAAEMPCDPSLFQPEQLVVDLVYAPRQTPWLAAAQANGAKTTNGLAMLAFQAVAQFNLWTGLDAPVETMLGAVQQPE